MKRKSFVGLFAVAITVIFLIFYLFAPSEQTLNEAQFEFRIRTHPDFIEEGYEYPITGSFTIRDMEAFQQVGGPNPSSLAPPSFPTYYFSSDDPFIFHHSVYLHHRYLITVISGSYTEQGYFTASDFYTFERVETEHFIIGITVMKPRVI